MSERKIKRALISVYDKTGIVDFARALADEFTIEIISTGGTAKLLKESGVAVTMVEEVTGFPEMMDGRVKTLHPKIHAGILADRDKPEHMRQLSVQGIRPIDIVVANLYPFEETIQRPDRRFEQAMEMIDIGGPCMLRAAAKNHRHVLVVAEVTRYPTVLRWMRAGSVQEHRRELAADVFHLTNRYDHAVAIYLAHHGQGVSPDEAALPDPLVYRLNAVQELRYGENPHQSARRYAKRGGSADGSADPGAAGSSYNNLVDAESARALCREVTRGHAANPDQRNVSGTVVFIKHTNACGVSVKDDPIEAYRQAYLGDPNAAMGGVLACSFDIHADFAQTVMETYARFGKEAGAGGFFVEVWIAASFDGKAVEVIRSTRKWGERVRLLSASDMSDPPDERELECKSISGGVLVQTRDLVGLNEDHWAVVTKRAPSETERQDMRLAWLIAKHTKSNAISVCKEGMLIGNGAGQMSRVMSCRIATWLAKENGHRSSLPGAAAASDAFFPFPDGPNILIEAGVTAIIQPGGSKRDADTIAACDERGVAMICTGTRHFKH